MKILRTIYNKTTAATHAGKVKLSRGAERVWPPGSEAQPNRDGVAFGSATL